MNVPYRTNSATSIHLSLIHSSLTHPFIFVVRRTSSDYTLTHYTLFLICIFFCSNFLCSAFQIDQVPSNHSLPFLSKEASLKHSPFNSIESSFLNLANRSTTNHDQFNEQNKKFNLSSLSSKTNSSFNYLDKSLYKSIKFKDDKSINKLIKLRTDLKDEEKYLVIDQNDLFNDRNHIFLNLTRIKLKRDQRNLERKNDSIDLIKLEYLNSNNRTIASYLNLSELYQNWLQDSIETNEKSNDEKIQNLDNLTTNQETASTPRNSLTMVVSMSILYIVIFFTGVFGNLGNL